MPSTTLPSDLVLDLLLILYEAERGSGELADSVGELRGREVPLATFYRQLQKAVDHRWIEIVEPGSSDLRDDPGPGRPERLYRISGPGERILRRGIDQQQRRVARAMASGLLMEAP